MDLHFIFITVILIVFSQFNSSNEEVFTATDDLKKLLSTEKSIAQLLDDYLINEDRRLTQLKLFRDNYQRVHKLASKDVDLYLANPVNAYLLVKRLTIDWQTVKNLVTVTPSQIGDQALSNLSKSLDIAKSFPSVEDLIGAADALIRLQDTYKLDTSTMARGQLSSAVSSNYAQITQPNAVDSDIELSAGDCFELGRHSYTIADYFHTSLWMKEAHERLKKETIKTADESEILEYLAFCTHKGGDTRKALEYTESLLHLQPNNQRALGNREYFISLLGSNSTDQLEGDPSSSLKARIRSQEYEALCRGESLLSPAVTRKFKCFHMNTTAIPYLRYMKIKVEEAYKEPAILLYHDVMRDSEIEKMKQLAIPRLTRSTVLDVKTGSSVATPFRIGKTAWLSDNEDEMIKRVTRRVELITGLTSESAEDTQVVNYGIGGHYDVHYDFANDNDTQPVHNVRYGNRVSTWLNYLSDVPAGGATVFPLLKVSVWPRKGSAAYWKNLHRDGTGDYLTKHAACPVLIGSKWIANKWFHERGQEFRMPCSLTPDT